MHSVRCRVNILNGLQRRVLHDLLHDDVFRRLACVALRDDGQQILRRVRVRNVLQHDDERGVMPHVHQLRSGSKAGDDLPDHRQPRLRSMRFGIDIQHDNQRGELQRLLHDGVCGGDERVALPYDQQQILHHLRRWVNVQHDDERGGVPRVHQLRGRPTAGDELPDHRQPRLRCVRFRLNVLDHN